MTKQEFLNELSQRLARLPQADADAALEFCAEFFEDAQSEHEAIETLGSPAKLAAQLIADAAAQNLCEQRVSPFAISDNPAPAVPVAQRAAAPPAAAAFPVYDYNAVPRSPAAPRAATAFPTYGFGATASPVSNAAPVPPALRGTGESSSANGVGIPAAKARVSEASGAETFSEAGKAPRSAGAMTECANANGAQADAAPSAADHPAQPSPSANAGERTESANANVAQADTAPSTADQPPQPSPSTNAAQTASGTAKTPNDGAKTAQNAPTGQNRDAEPQNTANPRAAQPSSGSVSGAGAGAYQAPGYANGAASPYTTEYGRRRGGLSAIWYILIGIFALPVALPVLLAVLALVLVLFIFCFAVLAAFVGVIAALIAAAVLAVAYGIQNIAVSGLGALSAGTALVLFGVALVLIPLLVMLAMWLVRVVGKLLAKLWTRLKARSENKHEKQ